MFILAPKRDVDAPVIPNIINRSITISDFPHTDAFQVPNPLPVVDHVGHHPRSVHSTEE
jgi:hypothetical protein